MIAVSAHSVPVPSNLLIGANFQLSIMQTKTIHRWYYFDFKAICGAICKLRVIMSDWGGDICDGLWDWQVHLIVMYMLV